MFVKRRNAREYVLKALYENDINPSSIDNIISDMQIIASNECDTNIEWEYMVDIFKGVLNNLEKIDNLILSSISNWDINRLPLIEKNILRMAIYEMLYRFDIDDAVIIDEAIEISKKYGEKNTYTFINGVLDRIFHEINESRRQG